MSAEPARDNVVPFPAPSKEQILAEKVAELSEDLAIEREEKRKLHQHNKSLRTQLDKALEQRAEEELAAELYDPEIVRGLIEFHYRLFGRKKENAPLSGVDGTIIRWCLNVAKFTPHEVCLASVGFAAEPFYRDKGMVSIQNMATTKLHDERKRLKDDEKMHRWILAGKKLRGEA